MSCADAFPCNWVCIMQSIYDLHWANKKIKNFALSFYSTCSLHIDWNAFIANHYQLKDKSRFCSKITDIIKFHVKILLYVNLYQYNFWNTHIHNCTVNICIVWLRFCLFSLLKSKHLFIWKSRKNSFHLIKGIFWCESKRRK